jgi:hypothetical protein
MAKKQTRAGSAGAENTEGGVVQTPEDQKVLDELKMVAASEGASPRGKAAARQIAALTGSSAEPVEFGESGEVVGFGRSAAELEATGEESAILAGSMDVMRDGKVTRIAAGTLVDEAELEDDELTLAVNAGIVRRATPAEAAAAKSAGERQAAAQESMSRRMQDLGVRAGKRAGRRSE